VAAARSILDVGAHQSRSTQFGANGLTDGTSSTIVGPYRADGGSVVTTDRKARNRRVVDLVCGVIAEIGMAGMILIWSWGGLAAEEAPFGAPASVAALTAAVTLLAAALVVRTWPSLRDGGFVFPALVAAWLIVTCLTAMTLIMIVGGDFVLWWQLAWPDGFAAAFAVGLTGVWSRLHREHAGRGVS
jgi:hypothetical protein